MGRKKSDFFKKSDFSLYFIFHFSFFIFHFSLKCMETLLEKAKQIRLVIFDVDKDKNTKRFTPPMA